MCKRIVFLWSLLKFGGLLAAFWLIYENNLEGVKAALVMTSTVFAAVVAGGGFAWFCSRGPIPLSEESIKLRQEANYKALDLGLEPPFPDVKIVEKRKGGVKHVATEPWNQVS